jgi:hypothetical protein
MPRYRVAVIGRTGRGNYGHGLDTVWRDLPNIDLVAVADDNEQGRPVAKLCRRLLWPLVYVVVGVPAVSEPAAQTCPRCGGRLTLAGEVVPRIPECPGFSDSQQEEKHGLLDNSSGIGTRDGWARRLAERGFSLKGHRLVKP